MLILASASACVLLVLWAAFAGVDLVVHTQGRIVPSEKQQLVQHLEGGIVSRVYVREGDAVQAGDPLVAVSALSAESSRGEKQARLSGIAARVARLQAEAAGQGAFTPPAGVPRNDPAVRAESDAFAARQARLAQSTRVLQEQARQRRLEEAELAAREKGLRAELELARAQLALTQNMVSRGAGSQSELLEARSRVERLETQISEAAATRQFRSEAGTMLSDARIELARLSEDIKTENDRVKRTVVTSPATGTVNKLLANTVGGVVKPGETLLELTPADEAIVVEARVSPAERGTLRAGLPMRVRVAAFDYTVYGVLDGRVKEVSADSLADERGERYFRLTAVVSPASAHSFAQPLSPGMTVTADVVTGQRTVLQYLLSPIRGLAATALRDRK
jgi:adhesin transport system membrane fusion protein